jgi:hypothetical protein
MALGTSYREADALSEARPAFTTLLPDLFDYTFEINGTEIFPNETIKRQITENYTESEYNTTALEYNIIGYHVNASNAKIHVDPSRIDDAKTRLDLQIYAEQVKVDGSADRYYDRVDLKSMYGIYDKETDMVTMHVPLDVALSYIVAADGT